MKDEGSPIKLSLGSRSPRKVSPEKRFPVKVSNPIETPRPIVHETTISLEEAVRQNEGLQRAIDIFEDEQSVLEGGANLDDQATVTIAHEDDDQHDDLAGPDDTMMSTFSTFSAVPNMTMFAKIGHTPTRQSIADGATPRARPEPTPSRSTRNHVTQDSGNTTNLLMDFTGQFRFPQKTPTRRPNPSPTRNHADVATTPARQLSNLIDFEIPPLPTPRSIPTITPRELESLKSSFLSEISGLKASLSGREAEVKALKAAVSDAEKRAGESMEQVREERLSKEHLSAEKESWEKRGREMETVLRKVKEEIVMGQREREELDFKLSESEKRREAAEMMAQEAESKMAGMRAGKATEEREKSASPDKCRSPASSSAREVEIAVERVARELHALYKGKHETKVAALKKSYENRWEKKVRELESKIEELTEENERIKLGRDATMTKVEPGHTAENEERKAQAAKDSAKIKELDAEVERLEAVVQTIQEDSAQLRKLLEQERVEKGELVILAEEMMSMQSFVATDSGGAASARTPAAVRAHQQQTVENLRGSISRASGLKAPGAISGTAESRIGRVQHERGRSGGPAGGLPRPGGFGARSGIMSSIEKMGNYRGRADRE
jgi:hypothetical protein